MGDGPKLFTVDELRVFDFLNGGRVATGFVNNGVTDFPLRIVRAEDFDRILATARAGAERRVAPASAATSTTTPFVYEINHEVCQTCLEPAEYGVSIGQETLGFFCRHHVNRAAEKAELDHLRTLLSERRNASEGE